MMDGSFNSLNLVEALGRLDAMPVGEFEPLPPVAPLPIPARMPFARNPHFVGREAEMRTLARLLKQGLTPVIGQVAAAARLGGIGKTSLAVEFVHRYGQFFTGGVFWLNASDPQNLPGEVAACGVGGLVQQLNYSDLPLAEQVRLVQQAWHSPAPRLLVFDNCEDDATLARWRPTSGGCLVLVTSRKLRWDAALHVSALPLGVFPREASTQLLRNFRPDLADEEVAPIAAELDDLPVALNLAGRYLKHVPGATPAAYLQALRNRSLLDHPVLQAGGAALALSYHELHAGRAFALSFGHLNPADTNDTIARGVLQRASFLAPGEPTPRELLLLAPVDPRSGSAPPRVEAKIETKPEPARENWGFVRGVLKSRPGEEIKSSRPDDPMQRLLNLGFLDLASDGKLSIHQLVAVFVQRTMRDSQGQAVIEQALLDVVAPMLEKGLLAGVRPLHNHVRHVTEAACTRNDERAGDLCSIFGTYLRLVGDQTGALPFYQRALQTREQVLGPYHANTALSFAQLGDVFYARGEYDKARPLYERALQIREVIHGSAHPDTLVSLNSLAGLMYDAANYSSAQLLYTRSLQLHEQVYGPTHVATAGVLNSLGELLCEIGDYTAARPYCERALRMRQQTLGVDHAETALSLNNLAVIDAYQGDLQSAISLMQRALAIREQVLGPTHTDTEESRQSLQAMLDEAGREA
ncbi:MAG: tetratricopeptide repeat protein [Chloroflexaceae bacterium]|jgi:tetratricopeptide (TPR) repeat protein|nr:tetratricopeptide repeat protein [Chloroflexaceae bacterium]